MSSTATARVVTRNGRPQRSSFRSTSTRRSRRHRDHVDRDAMADIEAGLGELARTRSFPSTICGGELHERRAGSDPMARVVLGVALALSCSSSTGNSPMRENARPSRTHAFAGHACAAGCAGAFPRKVLPDHPRVADGGQNRPRGGDSAPRRRVPRGSALDPIRSGASM